MIDPIVLGLSFSSFCFAASGAFTIVMVTKAIQLKDIALARVIAVVASGFLVCSLLSAFMAGAQ